MKKRPLKKRILDWLTLHLGVPLIYFTFRLIGFTLRRGCEGEHEAFYSRIREGGRLIVAFWHGDCFYLSLELLKVLEHQENGGGNQ